MRLIATVTDCVQVGLDSFRDVHTSMEFSENATIEEIVNWAKSVNPHNSFQSIVFSEIADVPLSAPPATEKEGE